MATVPSRARPLVHAALTVPLLAISAAAPPSLAGALLAQTVARGTGRISGLVTDASGQPLAGAQVSIATTTLGGVTNPSGRYTIAGVGPGTYTLRVQRIGFSPVTQVVTVADGQAVTADVRMTARAVTLDQVVTIGYGTARRGEVTGAVATVRGEDVTLRAAPTSAVSNALQGKAPGVQVITNSGTPGAGASVRIRGTNSITANSEPLYVIDGMPAAQGTRSTDPTFNPLNSIDPSEIESIDILKDASATAIYGARGANGVVLVTTKRGRRGSSQTSIETSYGTQSISKTIDPLSGPEYMRLRNEAYKNAGRTEIPYTEAQIAAAPSYNYAAMMIRRAPQQSQTLTFSGGSDRTRLLVSGNYTNQQGILVNSDFQRYGARVNADHEMSSRFRLGSSMNVTRMQQGLNRTENGGIGASGNGILAAMNFDPTLAPRDKDGNWTQRATLGEQLDNPVANAVLIKNPRRLLRLLGNTFAEYDVADGVRLRSTFNANMGMERTPQYRPSTSPAGQSNNGWASVYSSQGTELTNENTLNVRRTVFGSALDVLGGFSVQTSKFEDQYSEAYNFPTDAFTWNNLGAAKTRSSITTSATDWAVLSYLGRASYNLRDRYLFTVTGRRDGSSRFGANNKWALFPSAAFAWRAIDEGFMKDQSLFSDLKFRVSYGVTGNQAINEYQSLARLSSVFVGLGKNNEASGLAPSGAAANPDLKWETQRQTNLGLDAGFLDNRISISADVYQSRTKDLLLSVPLPRLSGFSSQLQNIGSVQNRGVELALTTVNVSGSRFSWRSTLNLSANRNEVLDLGSVTSIDPGTDRYGFFLGNQSSHIVMVGQPLGTFYGYKVDGLFQQGDACYLTDANLCAPGEYKVRDVNGDSKIDQNDRTILGSAQPKFYGGFSNNVSVGPFSVDAFVNFSQGNKVANVGRAFTELATGFLNEDTRVRDRWSTSNTNATIPRANNNRPRLLYSTMVEDGSFVRLQSLTFGYRLPHVPLVNASSARLYVTGQNLFVISDYSGYDPEVNSIGGDPRFPGVDVGAYPRARTWNVGLNVTF